MKKKLLSGILISAIVASNFIAVGTFAAGNGKSERKDKQVKHQQYGTGVKPYTAEDVKWMNENMEKVDKVLPNKIGLQRSNEVRRQKGLKALSEKAAVGIGDEIVLEKSIRQSSSRIASGNSTVMELSQSDLKSHVDNSTELPYFPPIRSQGSLGSCVAFATTYYQATHMNAMARGWNTKDNSDNTNKFSPKWTYNIVNGATGGGIKDIEAYKLMLEQGIATWDKLPYEVDPITGQWDYKKWTSDTEIWKDALKYKADKVGYVDVSDGTDTPVQYEKDDTLTNIKQLLSNGYVLCMSTDILNWRYSTVMDNDSTTSDDNAVGEPACYMVDDVADTQGHEMTIVGYNDDIWVDINKNGSPDPGEKGAFKIANSWGDNYSVSIEDTGKTVSCNGYIWFCYDALNLVSAVNPAPVANGIRKKGWDGYRATWITFKDSNPSSLVAQVTVNHSKRNQLECEIGYSEINESAPTTTYKTLLPNKFSGDCSFDGINQTSDGTMVFDYTSLIEGKDLSQTPKKWYITIKDVNQDGSKGIIKSFKLIDCSTGSEIEYPMGTYPEVDGSSTTLSIQYQLGSQYTLNSEWIYKGNINYNVNYIGHEIIKMDGNLYLIGENADDPSKYMLLKYNTVLDTWALIDDDFPIIGKMSKIVGYNGKIYILELQNTSYDYFELYNQIKVYDIASKSYGSVALPEMVRASGAVELGGQIYITADYTLSRTGTWVENHHMLKYDPSTNTFETKSGMEYLRISPSLEVVNGQIYAFSGDRLNTGGSVDSIEKYDPSNDTWSTVDTMPEEIIKKTPYYKTVSINNKVYLFTTGLYANSIYEYDLLNHTWTEKGSVPRMIGGFGIQQANGKIYIVPENSHNVLEFDPTLAEASRVPIPYISPESGTYSIPQTITMSTSDSQATIRYTTDGSTPTDSSPIYTGPIVISDSMTIKAVATREGMENSYVTTAEYLFRPQVQAPEFDIAGGTYKYAQRVSLSCATPGADIRYTTDGSKPTQASALYTGPITVSGNMIVKAVAVKPGMADSQIVSASYKTHSLIGDVTGDNTIDFFDWVQIKLYGPGKDFPVEDDLWAGDVNGDGVIDGTDADLVQQFINQTPENPYFFPKQKLPVPTFNLTEGTYISTQTVTISCPESEAIIRYTTDGSTPTSSSPIYNGPISVSESMTIKAVATIPLFVDSDVASASYVIIPKVDTPAFSLEGGTYTSIQTITISTATVGAEIRYTTDGSSPTHDSALYTGPITLNASKTIKAIAVKDGMPDSDEVSAEYILYFRVGDVTGDGNVDELDYTGLNNYLMGSTQNILVEDKLLVGDLDGDGSIAIWDLVLMRKYLNGEITYFPKEHQG